MKSLLSLNAELKRVNNEISRLHDLQRSLLGKRVEAIKNGHTFTGVPFHLHALILRFTGQDFLPGCGCQDMMERMEEWGPDGCREHLKEIVDKMESEGKKRGWKNKLLASVPIVSRMAMKTMVLYAIRKAEKDSTNDKPAAKKDSPIHLTRTIDEIDRDNLKLLDDIAST